MSVDPWSYAEKTKSEHAEQVALFMWAAMAQNYGKTIANSPLAYNQKNWAKEMFEIHEGPFGAVPLTQLKWLHAISNHGAGYGRQAEGVKAGVSDLFLPVPIDTRQIAYGQKLYHGLYIELKRQITATQKAGKPTEQQTTFANDMTIAGYKVVLCYGWEAARHEIISYLGESA